MRQNYRLMPYLFPCMYVTGVRRFVNIRTNLTACHIKWVDSLTVNNHILAKQHNSVC